MRDVHFFGICDGHGVNGRNVSSFIKQELPKRFAYYLQLAYCNNNNTRDPTSEEIIEGLERSIEETNNMLYNSTFDIKFSGSTLVV